jgi:predicted amidophosphoribosyltransferase
MKRLVSLSHMPPTDSALIKRLMSPQSAEILGRVARTAASVCDVPLSFVYLTYGGDWVLLASHGLTFSRAMDWDSSDYDYVDMGSGVFEVNDASKHDQLSLAAFVKSGPKFRYVIGAPLCTDPRLGKGNFVGLVCVDFEPRQVDAKRKAKVQQLAQMSGDIIDMMMTLMADQRLVDPTARETPKAMTTHGGAVLTEAPGTNATAQDPLAVEQFLLETLLHQPRMLRRRNRRYFGVRSWRKSIKRFQIDALKALKMRGSVPFVDAIASELAGIVREIYGDVGNAIIVPVPCGHSGPGCLSCRIARRMADLMQVDFLEAFELIEVKGSSHPATNGRRPKMKLIESISRPVILVDDVATSGAHLEEAANLLGQSSPNVWPIAWIAD